MTDRTIVSVLLPSGYKSPEEFAADCGLELIDVATDIAAALERKDDQIAALTERNNDTAAQLETLNRAHADMARRLAEAGNDASRYWEGRWRDADDDITRLRQILKTVRLYIHDQQIASAVVVPEGEPPVGNHPSLLQLIDATLISDQ